LKINSYVFFTELKWIALVSDPEWPRKSVMFTSQKSDEEIRRSRSQLGKAAKESSDLFTRGTLKS
jgi:hypothetical protein